MDLLLFDTDARDLTLTLDESPVALLTDPEGTTFALDRASTALEVD